MIQSSNRIKIKNAIGFVSLIVFIGTVLGIFSINYVSGKAVVAGIVICISLILIFNYINKRFSRSTIGFMGIVLLFLIFQIVLRVNDFFVRSISISPSTPPCPISNYIIIAAPETSQIEEINAQVYVTIRDNANFTPPTNWTPTYVDNHPGFSLPESQVSIERRGFLLKEVVFDFSVSCSENIFVELDDFPLNSFYVAHFAKDLQKYPYIDTETITWNSESKNIRFSYITPPFQGIRALLLPLAGASSINQWFMGIIGIVGTIFLTPIIKPVLIEVLQKFIKNLVSNPEVQTNHTTQFFIAEKGIEDSYTPEQLDARQKIRFYEAKLQQQNGRFSWDIHNELRHYWSVFSEAKSLSHANIILENSIMDPYILNILSDWYYAEENQPFQPDLAVASLLRRAKDYPELHYVRVACWLRAGEISSAKGDRILAQDCYQHVVSISEKFKYQASQLSIYQRKAQSQLSDRL